MSPIYSSMRREVEARGGQVTKFVGDGVMAVFGVPEVREDDALRALDAAIGMREALDRLAADIAREHGAVLSIKFGINTGEVVDRRRRPGHRRRHGQRRVPTRRRRRTGRGARRRGHVASHAIGRDVRTASHR